MDPILTNLAALATFYCLTPGQRAAGLYFAFEPAAGRGERGGGAEEVDKESPNGR